MSRPASETDILIIGAGPTGLLLANLLGAMGVRTTLIEKNKTTVQEPRAVSIDDESMRALQAAGVHQEIARITAKGYGSIYRGPDGRKFAEVKPTEKEFGFDKRNAFQQPEFEECLRRALNRHPSVASHFGTELENVTQDDDSVSATVRRGDARHLIQTKYMVACDGGRSTTRKMLGIALEGSSFEEPWLIVDLSKTLNNGFHTEVFCDPKRSAISLPGPDGIRRYEFKLNPGETVEDAEREDFARELLSQFGPDRDAPIKRRRVYTFHARSAERWREGRIFLAGDAAHLTPPFAGQGMNSGLRDAHNLAWKLDEALNHDDPATLLASYETERKPHAWEMINLALNMGRVMIPASPFVGWLTRTGFRLLDFYRPAKQYFVQMKYKPRPRFRGGMQIEDEKPRRATAVGLMIPQPVVDTPERSEVLLDALLPDKPVALVFDEHPESALNADHVRALALAGATVIGITPEWMKPQTADFLIVRDRSRFFSRAPFAGYLGHVLLLRRDRYVLTTAPIANCEALFPLLRAIRATPINTSATEQSRLIA